jgi:hypothetical protein
VADANRVLAGSDTVTSVVPPQPGVSISRDGHYILGRAVLFDAPLVRLLLVPVLLRLLGEAAWWLPRPLDRVLPKVRFGHA